MNALTLDSGIPLLVAFLAGAPLAYRGFDGVDRVARWERQAGRLRLGEAFSCVAGEGAAALFWITHAVRVEQGVVASAGGPEADTAGLRDIAAHAVRAAPVDAQGEMF